MGVKKYLVNKKSLYRVDTWIPLPDGTSKRVKKGKFPTREQAEAYEKKLHIDAYEGRDTSIAQKCQPARLRSSGPSTRL